MRILAIVLMLALSSCVTPWHPHVLLDGVEAQRLSHNTWRIFVRGHDFASAAAANDYAILQTAQTTIAHGGTHFVVLSPAGVAPVSSVDPGSSYAILKPGEDTIIKIVAVRRGRTAPADAFDADQVLRSIRARILAANWCGC
jgi:hypothetical protein